jgi:hypothetical protein
LFDLFKHDHDVVWNDYIDIVSEYNFNSDIVAVDFDSDDDSDWFCHNCYLNDNDDSDWFSHDSHVNCDVDGKQFNSDADSDFYGYGRDAIHNG